MRAGPGRGSFLCVGFVGFVSDGVAFAAGVCRMCAVCDRICFAFVRHVSGVLRICQICVGIASELSDSSDLSDSLLRKRGVSKGPVSGKVIFN